jgi:hypothetical protein
MVKSNGLGYGVSCRASNPPKEQQPPRKKEMEIKKNLQGKRNFFHGHCYPLTSSDLDSGCTMSNRKFAQNFR